VCGELLELVVDETAFGSDHEAQRCSRRAADGGFQRCVRIRHEAVLDRYERVELLLDQRHKTRHQVHLRSRGAPGLLQPSPEPLFDGARLDGVARQVRLFHTAGAKQHDAAEAEGGRVLEASREHLRS
jgi:hypothetical protein